MMLGMRGSRMALLLLLAVALSSEFFGGRAVVGKGTLAESRSAPMPVCGRGGQPIYLASQLVSPRSVQQLKTVGYQAVVMQPVGTMSAVRRAGVTVLVSPACASG